MNDDSPGGRKICWEELCMGHENNEVKKLKRVLGFWPAYGAAVGLVVSGTAMFSVGNVGGTTGYATLITALIALIPMMGAAFAYGELSSMLPGSGMISDYTMSALGRFWAIFSLLSGYVLLIAADGGTQLVMGGLSMESLVGIPQPIVTGVLFLFVILVNLRGVEFYGKTEAIITVVMMIVFAALSILGFAHVGESMGALPVNADLPFLPTGGWSTVFGTVGITIWFFIGFEFACPMAEENKKPYRNIPYGLIIGLLSIYVIDVLFSWASVRYTSLDVLLNSPIPHVEAARAMMGKAGFITMSLLTVAASLTTANAYAAALPRMLYGMARENLVPRLFAKIHPKYRTPWNGIFFTGALMFITFIYITINGADVNMVLTFIMTACITWMVSYAIAMLDVLILRKRYPDFPRLWKAPFAWITLPIGIIGVAYAIWTLQPYWLYSALAMVIVAVYALVWLNYQKLPIFERTPLEEIAKEIQTRSEYLAVWDEEVTEWLNNRAKQLPNNKRMEIVTDDSTNIER
jgi:amino acid transporter